MAQACTPRPHRRTGPTTSPSPTSASAPTPSPAGGSDAQQPHTEDEIYVCTTGRATLWTPDGSAPVEPGSVLFVPAGEEHRFVDVTEDLTVIVVFGPAEHSRKPGR
ncbi:cupin domain-containing protein [Nocardioides sp. TF02-7]|uniref:cupin domain-containing protein n=1 Tax=Nocardioides sp. TF02-7 TaxID=2917724 RepID=UPI001F0617D5|nr:cupin domain-containing protein [Nocardioides sp. TF02-7]UMG94248.1 cupin domain-containing protein [Nocardioides sp. TF02-7]